MALVSLLGRLHYRRRHALIKTTPTRAFEGQGLHTPKTARLNPGQGRSVPSTSPGGLRQVFGGNFPTVGGHLVVSD